MFDFIKWFLLIFGGLWIIWFFTGGPNRNISKDGLFIKQPDAPGEKWYLYNKNYPILDEIFKEDGNITNDTGEIREEFEQAQEIAGISFYNDKIFLREGNTYGSTAEEEYLIIESSLNNKDRINLTGWTLQSTISGQSIKIEKAVYLPQMYSVNYQEAIFLSPGEKAYITTGRSPIGTSFRTNLCTGYFEQFQNFDPSLDRECPRPEDEPGFITTGPNALNDACIDYVEGISKCSIVNESLPLDMQYECSQYINTKINYKTCVENHKNEKDFYRPEWRIFLNRNEKIWKEKREIIKLLDINGKVIDTVSY
ncbi:TPA: hypothetical protein DCZ46_01385 [Candidatus Campbellbacteria bacterium]|nr:MAG: seg [Candidatus Campbellbacteria bacterium GW2011_OD1_34_28]KKP75263.1 MAG: hypothetical protein UR74_C0001G0119 [Candidatus Campbellbacteria bacterium GW2011_GWD2_35_24]KKP76176.1 MAG: hypothetical protein UR75_C0001G0210 [Candidatus Campbellbacteria bacterium GW2011_GWC2_35_28]KKP77365.1 MAG: hypothetical protein UR76_C0001G0210 [Candidatus Campbellbacteria bacterium GW2011_GWC1_35_31]KKP79294.1 MAG: hypothetical protein UR79_C0001G0210 [Candidatus Campbellbacteria bacterium GW2011_GW